MAVVSKDVYQGSCTYTELLKLENGSRLFLASSSLLQRIPCLPIVCPRGPWMEHCASVPLSDVQDSRQHQQKALIRSTSLSSTCHVSATVLGPDAPGPAEGFVPEAAISWVSLSVWTHTATKPSLSQKSLSYLLAHLIFMTLQWRDYQPHFTEEEMEATEVKLLAWEVRQSWGFNPDSRTVFSPRSHAIQPSAMIRSWDLGWSFCPASPERCDLGRVAEHAEARSPHLRNGHCAIGLMWGVV